MNKRILLAGAAVASFAIPAAAQAQDAGSSAEPFVGVSVGYHDLGVDSDIADGLTGVEINDSSLIIGVVGGVDFPVSQDLFAGVEGNYHFGTSAVDSEYGASVRFGYRDSGGAKYYVRGGYQEVDFDAYKLIDPEPAAGTFDGVDTTDGDYLVGAGVEYPIGGAALRFNLDTISFDTLRATTGVAFTF